LERAAFLPSTSAVPSAATMLAGANGNAGDALEGVADAERGRRAGVVARCTAERLMKAFGLHGGPGRSQLQPEQAGRVVSGRLPAHVPTWAGFVYAAFVIDALSWRSSAMLCRGPIGSGFYLWALRP
jgi:hypothetical protein